MLTALQQTGLQGQTRVIMSSDHGNNQGVRGMWNKSTLYREATNIPLILAGPGIPEGNICNTNTNTNTNLIDIGPTVLDSAGLPADSSLPGRSLTTIANEADDAGRVGFSEYHAVGSPSAAYLLRQGQWAYHHYVGFEPELFDMAADPGQCLNLALEEDHRAVRQQMEKLLTQMLDPQAVDQQAKADQDALISRFGGREAALRKGPAGASPVPTR